jgi:metal-sulfur cluster biosynthetic enzyme
MSLATSDRVDVAVWRALDTVRDPELDEAVTTLGFVASCEVVAGEVEVHLRLPTYFCAPNFAYLMVADAFDAVTAVEGVRRVVVVLDDHFASDQINAGVAARAGFVSAFAGEAVDELDELRAGFVRRAVLAGTDRVCRPLVRDGRDVLAMTLGDAPPSADLDTLRSRRREVGLPDDDGSPLVIDVDTGERVRQDDLRLHLGRARLSQVNIEANSGVCRGMLAHRYGVNGDEGATDRKETA